MDNRGMVLLVMLWFGSEYDGAVYLREGVFRVLDDGLASPEIKCFAQSADGTIWMGTRDGITRIAMSGQNWEQSAP